MSEANHDFDDLPAGDGVLVLSPEQVILSATLQAERLLQRRLEPGRTLTLAEIFPEPYLPQAELAWRETLQTGTLRANLPTQIRLESGLALIGCNPEECHHSYGIDHTWSRVWVLKKLLGLCGLERDRLALAHSDIIKPEQFVGTVESFLKSMAALGPISRDAATQEKLQAVYDALHVYRVR